MGIIDIASGIFHLIRDFFNNRDKLALEKLKIYGKDKREAYKMLFAFAQKLEDSCFPLAERKQNDFISIMSNYYKDKLERYYLDFDPKTKKILKEFNEMYICMTAPDLIPETEDGVKAFFEDKIFSLISKLKKLANKRGTV